MDTRLFISHAYSLDRVKAMSFDQNHPKYFHTLCVGAHVTKAARSVAVFSLISFVLRTVYFLATQFKEWDRYITFMFFLDFCCVVALLTGVHKEVGWMVLPYLLDQLLSIVLMIFVSFAIVTEMPDMLPENEEYTDEVKITAVFMGAIVIGFMAYFAKIILNYFFYLSARDSHQVLSGLPNVSYHASAPVEAQNQYNKHQEAHAMEKGELPPPYERC